MAARDDSVIRGSLIACLIFLVLSLALNFFLYRWGDTQSGERQTAADRLTRAQDEIRTLEEQALTMKAMLGRGELTEEKYKALENTSSGDNDMDTIAAQFIRDMSNFPKDTPAGERSYPKLPAVLVDTIRNNNEQLKLARAQVTETQDKAKSDVAIAQQAQSDAEEARDNLQKTLTDEQQKYAADRKRINLEKEQALSDVTKQTLIANKAKDRAIKIQVAAAKQKKDLVSTIETQKNELNQLRNDSFETTQGLIRHVSSEGEVVTINLGSGDALRPGVTFGVIDGTETRLKDADIKASIQVTKIKGLHLAEARVVRFPKIESPIINGDKIYSPFWAPGRVVRIALAGDIDIDGDKKPDNDDLVGMVRAAGAEVVAQMSSNGAIDGKLDARVRFLVTAEEPDLSRLDDDEKTEEQERKLRALSRIKAKATELGLTIIPAWKLQAYLRTINDTLTTPLGTAARAEDFPAKAAPNAQNRLPTDLPELYKRNLDNVQTDKEILPP